MINQIVNLLKEYRRVRWALNAAASHITKVDLNLEQKTWIQEIKSKGYMVIPDYYSKGKCLEIISEIETLFNSFPEYVWKDKLNADHRIYGADRLSAKIKAFYADPTLNKLAIAFNEVPVVNSHTLIGKIASVPNNLGSGQGWHRDTASPYQFKSLLYLTDVNDNNGPFEFLVGSQDINSLYHGIWKANIGVNQTRFSDQDIQRLLKTGKYQLDTLTAKAGTLVLVNTFGIHRGKPITQGHRYALTNYFMNKYSFHEDFFRNKFNIPVEHLVK